MGEVAACREAAREAVRDIEPDGLQAVMDDLLSEASMTPGVVTLRAARAARDADGDAAVVVEVGAGPERERASDPDENGTGDDFEVASHVAERAAGVQLIYDGLRLIRRLAAEDPWSAPDGDCTDENLAVLAADVLVSRGFYLLARTEAADKAVETVRNFGRDQTIAREQTADADAGEDRRPDPEHDRNLEADVLQLALIAGTAGTPGVAPSRMALSTAAEIGQSAGDPLADPETVLDGVRVGLASGSRTELGREGEATRSATDP